VNTAARYHHGFGEATPPSGQKAPSIAAGAGAGAEAGQRLHPTQPTAARGYTNEGHRGSRGQQPAKH